MLSKTLTISIDSLADLLPAYVKVVAGTFELNSAVDLKILAKLCAMSNSRCVHLTAGSRRELLNEFGLQNSHLSNSLNRLKKAGLITGSQGTYELNPVLSWEQKDKLRGLELKIKFVIK